jgi:hypothetical protein
VSVELSSKDREALLSAKLVLEHPGVAAKAAELLGKPLERGLENLPHGVQRAITQATETALKLGLRLVVSTLDHRPGRAASPGLHKLAGSVAGAAGGFFGLLAIPAELPISTLIILRAIADIARSEGEDLREMEARLACLEVLALSGGKNEERGATDTGYYAARIGLAQSLHKALEHLTRHGVSRQLAPPVADLLTRVAARFSIQVSQEVLAKAVPVVGAASGAAINALFVHHFQDVARAHFTIRRLERHYGSDHIKDVYTGLNWIPPVAPNIRRRPEA